MESTHLWDIIDKLRDELNIASDGINDLNDVVKDLQAENNSFHGQYDEIQKLKGDLAVCEANVECLGDVKGYLQKEKERLKADNKRLNNDNKKRLNEIIELTDANKRLVKQVSSNRGSNSTSHTIQSEIDEYMSHNDKCKDARLFLLPIESFDDDGMLEVTWLLWDDGMSS